MVYLIGVDHIIQHNNENADSSTKGLRIQFKNYLQEQGKQLNITLIAEEFSQETLDSSNGIYSNARYVAEKLKIEHRFCNPNRSEREAIGIKSKEKIIENLDIKGKDLILLSLIEPMLKDEKSEQEIMERLDIQEKDLNILKQKGIKINEEEKKDFPKRERFWLNKIRDKANEPMIFICGDDHIESFKSTLINKGYKVEVLSSNCWGKGL